jgi:hypothetical protein
MYTHEAPPNTGEHPAHLTKSRLGSLCIGPRSVAKYAQPGSGHTLA